MNITKATLLINYNKRRGTGMCSSCNSEVMEFSETCKICGKTIDYEMSECLVTDCKDCYRNPTRSSCPMVCDKLKILGNIQGGNKS